jgi:protein involved in polysaccharide export with SLBB domain
MKFMKYNLPKKSAVSCVLTILMLIGMCVAYASAQKTRRNSPFAPNPKGRTEIAKNTDAELKKHSTEQKTSQTEPEIVKIKNSDTEAEKEIAPVEIIENSTPGHGAAETVPSTTSEKETPPVETVKTEEPSIVKKEESAEKANLNLEPSEIYKIGVGDILYISLQNAPAKESTYFTVLADGTIDYPLAGEMISVKDLTAVEIEGVLREKIKLYEDPQVSVKVREHNSHHYTVLGMVEKPGEKVLQREAYPLLVVRAEAVVKTDADRAVIKRNNSQIETIDLKDVKSEDILIYSGDVVEFTSSATAETNEKKFFYIGGEIQNGGKKDYLTGMTLTQAILASGGLKKQSIKRVVIGSLNEAGMRFPRSYDLKAIKDGKSADPEIKPGDTIEVGN